MKKPFKVSEKFDAKIHEQMFQELYDNSQEKYHAIQSSVPANTDGKNGEIRIVNNTNGTQIVVKANNQWYIINTT